LNAFWKLGSIETANDITAIAAGIILINGDAFITNAWHYNGSCVWETNAM